MGQKIPTFKWLKCQKNYIKISRESWSNSTNRYKSFDMSSCQNNLIYFIWFHFCLVVSIAYTKIFNSYQRRISSAPHWISLNRSKSFNAIDTVKRLEIEGIVRYSLCLLKINSICENTHMNSNEILIFIRNQMLIIYVVHIFVFLFLFSTTVSAW